MNKKIDIQKYEGHSTEYSYEIVSVDDDKDMDATYALLNDAPLLLAEVKLARSEIEHLNKMFCVGCGACGTETEYAECTCTEEQREELMRRKD